MLVDCDDYEIRVIADIVKSVKDSFAETQGCGRMGNETAQATA